MLGRWIEDERRMMELAQDRVERRTMVLWVLTGAEREGVDWIQLAQGKVSCENYMLDCFRFHKRNSIS